MQYNKRNSPGCYSDDQITYIITAHGSGMSHCKTFRNRLYWVPFNGHENKIPPSVLENINFYTLVDDGDKLYAKSGNLTVDAQFNQYKLCNCNMKLIQHFHIFNDILLANDPGGKFISGVYKCGKPGSNGISVPSLIIPLEERSIPIYDPDTNLPIILNSGIPFEYASTLSDLMNEIKVYHQRNEYGKSIKIVLATCLGDMSSGIEQISSMLKNTSLGGKRKIRKKHTRKLSKKKIYNSFKNLKKGTFTRQAKSHGYDNPMKFAKDIMRLNKQGKKTLPSGRRITPLLLKRANFAVNFGSKNF